MKIVVLAASATTINPHDGSYPLCLTEFDGVPLIQHIVRSCAVLQPAAFVFALRRDDIKRHYLDQVVELLAPHTHVVPILDGARGAACSALYCAPFIGVDEELLIVSANQLFRGDFAALIARFRDAGDDAGVLIFDSVHPRYSFVRLGPDGHVTEAAEKRPISRHATAGIFWFRRGGDFLDAAQAMIRKDAAVDGIFYIAPALNELVLRGLVIGAAAIDPTDYFPLKTERQLSHFEAAMER